MDAGGAGLDALREVGSDEVSSLLGFHKDQGLDWLDWRVLNVLPDDVQQLLPLLELTAESQYYGMQCMQQTLQEQHCLDYTCSQQTCVLPSEIPTTSQKSEKSISRDLFDDRNCVPLELMNIGPSWSKFSDPM